MRRTVCQVYCPECHRRIRAGTEDELRARLVTHSRNCNALKRAARASLEAKREEPAP